MAVSTYEPLKARRDLPPASGARLSDSNLAASPLMSIGYRLTLLYIVLLVARVPEITTVFLGSSFYQILILNAVLLAITLISGTILKVGATRGGAIWIAFHLWIIFTLPFSGYRRGSIESLINLLVFIPGLFFVGGFLSRSGDSLRKGLWALAWSGVIALLFIQYSGAQLDEDRLVAVGSFGNSNLLAIYLLLMIPVWFYIAANTAYSWVARGIFGGVIVLALATILKTGSRSGLLTVGLLSAILFFSVSLANKAKMIVVGAIGVFLALGTMSDALKTRVSTIFHSKNAASVEAIEAAGSSEARFELLKDSIDVTLRHPVVGGGFGVYSSVSSSEKESRGERATWQVTHNMYTQISSELGLPGFILYLMGLVSNIRTLWRVTRAGRVIPEAQGLGAVAAALLCSWVVFCFNGFFASMALDFMLYVLTGFSLAVGLVFEDLIRRQSQTGSAAGQTSTPARSTRFFPAASPTLAPAPGSTEAVTVPAVVVDKTADAAWRRNPRKYPPKPGAPSR